MMIRCTLQINSYIERIKVYRVWIRGYNCMRYAVQEDQIAMGSIYKGMWKNPYFKNILEVAGHDGINENRSWIYIILKKN